jgi:hypothetical protein
MIAGGYVSQEKKNKIVLFFKTPTSSTRKLLIGLYDAKEKWG